MHSVVRAIARVKTAPVSLALHRTFSTHGAILMKATKAPEKTLEEIGIEQIKERVANTDYSKMNAPNYRMVDDLYDETDPLHCDMLEIEPQHPQGTLIWLLGLGDTHQKSRPLFEMLRTHHIRFAVPNPPKIPLTALEDASERAWFDVFSNKYSETDEEDYTGIKRAMYRLHDLIHEEADALGKLYAPEGTDPLEARKIGAQRIIVGGFGQGGALSLFAGIRYPHKLGGMVSFSGYFPHVQETAEAMELARRGKDEDGNDLPGAVREPPNLKTPVLVIHGQADDAIPWATFAKPRYLRAVAPPLSIPLEVRPSYSMGHFMGTNEMMSMHQWVSKRIEDIHAMNK